MAVDIHMYTEARKEDVWKSVDVYKKLDNGTFEMFPVWEGTCSELFGILAGVRSMEYKPIKYPRGFPADVTELPKAEYEAETVAFSASWYTLTELNRWASKHTHYVFEKMLYAIQDRYDRIFYTDDRTDDFRIIFWFDN